ncbi:MAG: M6 family metalloprotease domain-containing protein [Candidatus Bathyarchaeia archaeon]
MFGRRAVVALVFLVLSSNLVLLQLTQSVNPSTPITSLAPPLATYLGQVGTASPNPQILPVLGVIRVLVIAVAFSDVKPTLSINEVKQEWFGTVPAYYHEISYGKLTIQGDVFGWYKLPHPESYYGRDCKGINDPNCSGTNQSWKIANDTVPLAEKDVNFNNYNYYVFIHSGTGQETSLNQNDIWSVTYLDASVEADSKTLTRFSIVSELEAPPNVPNGVWCVEFAHDLGVPDLYNTTKGPNDAKTILGPWDLMDKGSWNGDPPGSLPAHMTAWAKIQLGFISGPMLETAPSGISTTLVDPTEISSNNVHAIKVPVGDSQNSTQYYLVEVRKQIGFDAALPGAGVLITFVNEHLSIGKVQLINGDPGVADLTDAVWQLDQTFTESRYNLTITVSHQTGSSYEITVARGTSPAPTIGLDSNNSTAQIVIAGVHLTVKLATTLPVQERGLSGLPSLPTDEGMLFVFDHEDYWGFWMINMSFPLDIIWFNSARQVIWTEPDLKPCPPYDCPVITPNVKSMYVLEVNAGFIVAHHITLGTTFSFSTS